jgi:hypothetical protein
MKRVTNGDLFSVMSGGGNDGRVKVNRGVCPLCRVFVGVEHLVEVRGRMICESCGNKEIETWRKLLVDNLPRP